MLECTARGVVLPRQIIVVLAGSDPNNPNLVQEETFRHRWQARMPQVDFLLLRNTGPQLPGFNRNMGIEAATSSILTFFDADDVPTRDRIATLLGIFELHSDLDYVIHHFQRFSDASIPAESWRADNRTVPHLFFEKGETKR
mmetsp:Transcript_2159/g.3524  ORF Transcript_2159/g.3524 Transcript_2159/m.3524 type:complete len:142 (-) Transcript_2159:439-864(-)